MYGTTYHLVIVVFIQIYVLLYVSILGNFWAQHLQTKCSLSKRSMMKAPTEGIFFLQPSEQEDHPIMTFIYFANISGKFLIFSFTFLFEFQRYSCFNEINKYDTTDDMKTFVYFVIKLPRMEGGTTYVGFQGG